MKDILVSVIIPVHNTEKYIKKCIDSIANQTYTNWELLLVDDESTDRSGDICKEYAKNNSKIRYIAKKQGGSADARNVGIEQAKGDYLYFVDSDDYCEQNLLEVIVEILDKHQVPLVSFGYYRHKKYSKASYFYGNGKITRKQTIESLLLNEKITNYVWNKVFARELFDDIRFPVGKIFEDVSIMYKIMLKCDYIFTLDMKLYHYQIRENSLSCVPSVSQLLYYWKVLFERKIVVEQIYVDQKENVAISLLKGSIYIWNQLSRQCKKCQLKEYDFFIENIRKNSCVLKTLSLRYKVMGYLICKMPYKYAAFIHFLKGKK